MKRGVRFLAVALVCAIWAAPGLAALMPIEGVWKLDEKSSKNVPESQKMIDLKIEVPRGREFRFSRLYDGAMVGEVLVVSIDGKPVQREVAKGQTATISMEWKAGGRLLEQIVRLKQTNLMDTVQTTHFTVTDDGEVMTRFQTIRAAGDVTERVLIYRRKK